MFPAKPYLPALTRHTLEQKPDRWNDAELACYLVETIPVGLRAFTPFQCHQREKELVLDTTLLTNFLVSKFRSNLEQPALIL